MYRSMSLFLIGFFIIHLFSIVTFAQASFEELSFTLGGGFVGEGKVISPDGNYVTGIDTNGLPVILSNSMGTQIISSQNGTGMGVVNGGMAACGTYLSNEAFYWTPSGGDVALGFLPGATRSNSSDISDDGQVVVGSSTDGSSYVEGFFWTPGGGMIGVGDLPGGTSFRSYALGVSGNGNVVVGASRSVNNLIEAFRWTGVGSITGLGTLPGHDVSQAVSASFDGSVIVGFSDSGVVRQATMWDGASIIGLGRLPGDNQSVAVDISGDGTVVVGYGFGTTGMRAIIWDEVHGIRELKQVLETEFNLDLTGWRLTHCRGISSDGNVIVGTGVNPVGLSVSWRAVLPSNIIAWSNGQGGDFSVGSNWVGGVVPNDNQIALFDTAYYTTTTTNRVFSGQPITITFDQITATGGLDIKDRVNFDLQSHSYGLSSLQVGSSAGTPDEVQLEIINGVLGVDLGSTAAIIGAIGERGQLMVGSSGTFEVDTDDPNGKLVIGANDCGGGECGRLVIQNGGIVYTNSSGWGSSVIGSFGGEGSAFITGDGSIWTDSTLVAIGEDGVGLLDINNSGQFIGKSMTISVISNSQGTVSVSGEGSLLELSDELLVGLRDSANFTISNSATAVINLGISIGLFSGGEGEVTVEGNNSYLAVSDTTFIGGAGSGGLSVLDGGKAIISVAAIPGDWGGIGSGLVDGIGSEWDVILALWIGQRGVGFVRVTNQGILKAGKIQIGPLGSIDASGGNLIIGGNPPPLSSKKGMSGISGTVYVDTLLLSSGAQVVADSVIFGEGGYLGSEDTLSFDVINSGGINPGDTLRTTGIFTVDANYAQLSSGTLFIELEGDVPGTGFDQLVVNGNAQLAGTLDVSTLNIYEPMVGQTFEILTANNITGTFDNVVTHRGFGVSVTYNSTNIIITVTSPVSVDDENKGNMIPTEYSFEQNYPNPFNPTTTITYSIPKEGLVTLKVYNVIGEEDAVLLNEVKQAGYYNVSFNASELPSGIYFYRLQAGDFVEIKKMVLMK